MELQTETEHRIIVENLFKIFGKHPERGLEMVRQGMSKEDIFEQTGLTVGVSDATFKVRTGEIFVVMGLSGSGKSTLVRLLNRLIDPTAGHVYVDGKDVAQMGQTELVNLRRRDMCMVFQSFALMPHMTVLENVAFGLEMSGADRRERDRRANEALKQVGLAAWGESLPAELSGGMQQRVGLARGLAVDPTVMLMDEAFSALDPLIRNEMQDELLKLQDEHKRTIVFISHDLDEAMRIGDRIAIMEGGRIVQVGTPEEILRNPADEYVRAFFRGVDPTNILTARDIVSEQQVTVIRHPGEGPRAALERLIRHDREYAYVLDSKKKFQGVVSADSLKHAMDSAADDMARLTEAVLPAVEPVQASQSLQDILTHVTDNPWPVPVVDETGRFLGTISKNVFLRTLQRDAAEHSGEIQEETETTAATA